MGDKISVIIINKFMTLIDSDLRIMCIIRPTIYSYSYFFFLSLRKAKIAIPASITKKI